MFFLKQKTAYEVRISDWSSDVCSSDLPQRGPPLPGVREPPECRQRRAPAAAGEEERTRAGGGSRPAGVAAPVRPRDRRMDGAARVVAERDRKRVVEGKSVAGRVDHGGWRISKKIKVRKVDQNIS